MYFRIAVLIFLLLPLSVFATKRKKSSEPYIKSYNKYVNITTFTRMRGMYYRIALPKELKLIFGPSDVNQIGFKLKYSIFSFSYAYNPNFLNDTKQVRLKGDNKQNSGAISFDIGQLSTDLYFNYVQGFYLRNTADYTPGFVKGRDPYIQFPSMSSVSLGAEFTYNTNKRFSEASIYSGSEQQIKTASTLLPILNIAINTINDDSYDSNTVKTDYLGNIEFTLALPYALNYVITPSINACVLAGPIISYDYYQRGVSQGSTQTIDGDASLVSWGYLFKGGVKYSKQQWFCGLQGYLRGTGRRDFNLDGRSDLGKVNFSVQLYAGIRLKAPKFAEKSALQFGKIFRTKMFSD